jgi:predicted PurR-regulated permease PerM
VITSFAGSAMVTLGWALFVMIISYFLLADAGAFSGQLVRVDIPGYEEDLRRLGNELRDIWNAFLRGQLLVIVLVIISYTILLSILDMHYTFGIAVLAGLARLVPYIGPLVVWVVTALVAFFQPENYFGLEPVYYTVLVVVSCLVLDQIFDNMVSPRILGQTLKVHPAAILVAAIIFTNLIGVIGLVLAAPVVATINLVSRYIFRKLFDRDPWPEEERDYRPTGFGWNRTVNRLRDFIRNTNRS